MLVERKSFSQHFLWCGFEEWGRVMTKLVQLHFHGINNSLSELYLTTWIELLGPSRTSSGDSGSSESSKFSSLSWRRSSSCLNASAGGSVAAIRRWTLPGRGQQAECWDTCRKLICSTCLWEDSFLTPLVCVECWWNIHLLSSRMLLYS